jgi:hypothetical protein
MGLSNYSAANMLLKPGQIRLAYAGLMQFHIIKIQYNSKRQKSV